MRIANHTLLGGAVALLLACGGGGGAKSTNNPSGGGESGGGGSSSGMTFDNECVDPVSDGDTHDPTRPADHHVQLDVKEFDLDSDGEVDYFVKPAWPCGHGCYRSAYVARKTCGHYVGTFPSEDNYEALDDKTNGLKDIKARPKKSDGQELHCYQVIWKFDGKQYQANKHRECECKDEAPKCEADWTDGGMPL
jgi:hypothetical protein